MNSVCAPHVTQSDSECHTVKQPTQSVRKSVANSPKMLTFGGLGDGLLGLCLCLGCGLAFRLDCFGFLSGRHSEVTYFWLLC